jgi:hypothetical protein
LIDPDLDCYDIGTMKGFKVSDIFIERRHGADPEKLAAILQKKFNSESHKYGVTAAWESNGKGRASGRGVTARISCSADTVRAEANLDFPVRLFLRPGIRERAIRLIDEAISEAYA